ncbi:N-acetyltransferase GCN5 [Actinoplanes sp. SE50]|uniref:GNAT family N-acetyltransferase n=1 Tax=unclassified Actinoplanes TaxID=2626549 RepID=UPI00023EBBA1|nr:MULTISPECIES: GNAT family N-acetyltransferase [unclassified Actinoplanes]AEV84514.1 GCN5-related N-acetyltransferase [Actinoplanes sp. SE50/110]ATO82906.1 N-acetyltransferase GCN5 [Actinoplanes sp. SE50]SLM00314.1 N-acetyltransferase GCN5 [Actinoplanes sp. SE50/110]
MQVRALDPHDPEAGPWHAAFRAGLVAGREQPTVAGAESTLTSLRTIADNAVLDRRAFGAWDGGECLGGVIVDLPRVANTHTVGFELAVAPRHRGRGAGTALWEAAVAVAREHGRRVVSTELPVPLTASLAQHPGGRFALARGFAGKLQERRYLLGLPAEPVAAEVPAGYRLHSWTGPVPAGSAADFAAMCTLMERDVPTGDRDHDPVVVTAGQVLRGDERLATGGWGLVTTLLGAPDGRPGGYTRIFVNADRRHAQQDDTFVLRAHRGRRLGAVLKSANLARLTEHFPGVRLLHSWTADDNGAMIATNRRFGFRPVEILHTMEGPVP